MTRRNLSLSHNFVCVTDDTTGLDQKIDTIELPKNLENWWSKLYLFSQDIPLEGTILYFDLDVVISDNIDKLFEYEPGNWCIIRDFTRALRPRWQGFNSSVMRFQAGENNFIWDFYCANSPSVKRKYLGDQEFIYHNCKENPPIFWPDNWIQSWKWEIRKNKEIDRTKRKGQRSFKHKEKKTKPPKDCCVVVFHGDPSPDFCNDNWVLKNWQ